MLARVALGLIAVLSFPAPGTAQEASAPLARGDSVRFSLPAEEGGVAIWTGIVREVKNPRDCFFIVTRSIEGSKIYSIGVPISPESDFVVERLDPTGKTERVSAAALWDAGIRCVEGHPSAEPVYLNPAPAVDTTAEPRPGG